MRRITLSRWITLVAVLGGIAIDCIAVSVIVRDPSSDGAWAAVLLGVSFVVWGIAFAHLADRPDTEDEDEDAGKPVRVDRVDRLIASALTVMVFTAAYAIARWHQVPVWWAFGGAVIALGLPMVNRALDRRIARDEQAEGTAD
ncbi:hypothetical protein [Curtobacterium sp. PhB115]|uniref:hypothetical protein n=1 Tax=Curtobacterium sp. PhB115 TaxID=2485173 RepID=UPI000F4BC0D1|nr:hypothetical protein [Curtobacterium sp. PhB115]